MPKLKSVVIPDSVTEIVDAPFSGCENLEKVTMSKNTVIIDFGAFSGCHSLKEIWIPKTTTYIDGMAFSECYSLKKITIESGNPKYYLNSGVVFDKDTSSLAIYPAGKEDKSYTVPSGIVTVGKSAFCGNKNITSVVLPDSVTKIDKGAFEECSNLSSIKFSKNLKALGSRCFRGTGIITFEIPSTVTSVEYEIFCDCAKLTKVVLPNNMTELPASTFEGCISLTNVTFPEKLEKIGEYCFANTGIITFKIPSTVTSIGSGIFDGCAKLTKVVMSDNIKELPESAFGNCISLTSVTLPNKLEIIGESAFYGCSALKSLVIPNTVKQIGGATFMYCNSLNTLVIPSSVEKIGNSCFVDWKDSQNICFVASKAGEQFDEYWNESSQAKVYFGALPLTDVLPNAWYFKAVKYAYNNRIVNGTGEQTFSPNAKLTRGMLVTILYGMEGAPKITASNIFSDVSSKAWYYNAVLWASSKGIVNGSNGKFKPDDNITRQDLAVILMAYSRYKKKYVASNNTIASFSDKESVSSYATNAVKWAVTNRIINGSNGKINPKGNATRAEAVTMIYSYILKFDR